MDSVKQLQHNCVILLSIIVPMVNDSGNFHASETANVTRWRVYSSNMMGPVRVRPSIQKPLSDNSAQGRTQGGGWVGSGSQVPPFGNPQTSQRLKKTLYACTQICRISVLNSNQDPPTHLYAIILPPLITLGLKAGCCKATAFDFSLCTLQYSYSRVIQS